MGARTTGGGSTRGGVTGVGVGAVVGTAVLPGLGTLIGAGIGGLLGGLFGDDSEELAKQAEAEDLARRVQADYANQIQQAGVRAQKASMMILTPRFDEPSTSSTSSKPRSESGVESALSAIADQGQSSTPSSSKSSGSAGTF